MAAQTLLLVTVRPVVDNPGRMMVKEAIVVGSSSSSSSKKGGEEEVAI